MIRVRILSLLTACMIITACSETAAPPSVPLKEKLTGKTPEERQEILGLACLDEAESINGRWKHTRHGSTLSIDNSQFHQTQALCLRMMVAYPSSDVKKSAVLAQQCKEQISPALHSDHSSTVAHAHKMQEICETMTGQKIDAK